MKAGIGEGGKLGGNSDEGTDGMRKRRVDRWSRLASKKELVG